MILVTAEEMRRFDDETIRGVGVPGVALMETAGRAVADRIAAELDGRVPGARVVVACGPGNNGGDGCVVARHLCDRGADVVVLLCADEARIRGDARVQLAAARGAGVTIVAVGEGDVDAVGAHIDGARVLVDALFGTGAARPLAGRHAEIVERMNRAGGLRVAVDVPSGLDVDRGQPLGACFHADVTVTFAFAKVGLVTSPGHTFVGRLQVADIGIPARLAAGLSRRLLDDDCLAPLRAPRAPGSHKGTFGHLLVVAGSKGHPGAAILCAEAAARTGAGLVTIAAPDETERALATRVREVSTVGLGPEPLAEEDAAASLLRATKGKSAVALGPGVPRDDGMRAIVERVIVEWERPAVIDADGLNLLAEAMRGGRAPLRSARGPRVLTPHPAEMARLVGCETSAVQADRVGVAARFAAEHGVVLVLKGARTVIAAPDGRLAINPTGNPGLASGGTGDVLTGVVGALLAGGLAPFEAACAGAYLHGRAGDLARDELGEAGLIASDVIAHLPRARR